MICRDCHQMQDLPSCPLATLNVGEGFTPTDHVVQVYGYCAACAGKHKSL